MCVNTRKSDLWASKYLRLIPQLLYEYVRSEAYVDVTYRAYSMLLGWLYEITLTRAAPSTCIILL